MVTLRLIGFGFLSFEEAAGCLLVGHGQKVTDFRAPGNSGVSACSLVGSESHAAGSDQGTITVGHAALSSAVVMAALDPESLPEEPLDSMGFWLTVN